jgi:hypothetical protein
LRRVVFVANVLPDSGMKEETTSDPKQVMERHIAAENARDFEADPWSADPEMVTLGAHLRGREQILGFNRDFWEAFA